jgi:hypothetical protein
VAGEAANTEFRHFGGDAGGWYSAADPYHPNVSLILNEVAPVMSAAHKMVARRYLHNLAPLSSHMAPLDLMSDQAHRVKYCPNGEQNSCSRRQSSHLGHADF